MKTYVKPDLFYENFALSHNIAACNVLDGDKLEQATFNGPDNCTYDYFGAVLFNNGGCEATPEEVGYESYCIQTNTSEFNFFAS